MSNYETLVTAYNNARRAYRAAWVAYQNASGADYMPALNAWDDADKEVRRLERLL
jgi:hypothetical protein